MLLLARLKSEKPFCWCFSALLFEDCLVIDDRSWLLFNKRGLRLEFKLSLNSDVRAVSINKKLSIKLEFLYFIY